MNTHLSWSQIIVSSLWKPAIPSPMTLLCAPWGSSGQLCYWISWPWERQAAWQFGSPLVLLNSDWFLGQATSLCLFQLGLFHLEPLSGSSSTLGQNQNKGKALFVLNSRSLSSSLWKSSEFCVKVNKLVLYSLLNILIIELSKCGLKYKVNHPKILTVLKPRNILLLSL